MQCFSFIAAILIIFDGFGGHAHAFQPIYAGSRNHDLWLPVAARRAPEPQETTNIPRPNEAVRTSRGCDYSNLPVLARDARKSVAVIDFQIDKNIPSNAGQFLADQCRRMILQSHCFILVNRENMQELLGEEDFAAVIKCDNTKCLVDYGKKLKAQEMINGRVSKLDNSLGLTIKMTDVGSAQTVALETLRRFGTIDDLSDAIGPATCKVIYSVFGIAYPAASSKLSPVPHLHARADTRKRTEPQPAKVVPKVKVSGPDPFKPARRTTLPQPRGFARRVNIKFKGPAIGIAPHYLAYSVDLPPSDLAGADFLWKDNGVWMGDEAHGVKILESAGLHLITVLLVTRDNVEYRGAATVQVLQRGPPESNTLGQKR